MNTKNFLKILLLLFLFSCQKQSYLPYAKKGKLNLSKWDFNSKGIVKLNGEWEFYWKQLNDPEKLNSSEYKYKIIKIPKVWNRIKSNNNYYDDDGYATYKLEIDLNESNINEQLGIKIPEIPTSYKLWINQKLLIKKGKVGTTKKNSKPEINPEIIFFTPVNKHIVLVIQISNFFDNNAGLWKSLYLGTKNQILSINNLKLSYDLFLIGCFLITFLYHLILYFYRHENKTTLFFGLFCLTIALRISLTGEFFLFKLFPDFNWHLYMQFNFVIIYITAFFCNNFMYYKYQKSYPKVFIRIINAFYLSFIIFALINFNKINLITWGFFQYFIILNILLFLYIFIRSFIKQEEHSIFILIGIIALSVTTINDILYGITIIHTGYFLSVGLLIFVLTHSADISIHFSKSFQKVKKLSKDLKVLNQHLEDKIIERTEELRIAKDEAVKANLAKSKFLVNVSHDIRTPLNGIIGYSELINKTKDKDLHYKYVKSIIDESDKLLELINQLLDLSKIESRKLEIYKKTFELDALLEQVQSTFNVKAKEKGLKYIQYIENEIPNKLIGDPMRLRQILNNLIGNAIKFTKKGKIKIEIKKEKIQNNKITILFKVIDTGVGIPKEKQHLIFDRFTQIEKNPEINYEGTGLGTSISKELVKLMGGIIGFESTINQGSTFWFKLSFEKGKIDKNIIEFKKEKMEDFSILKNKSILVVEDYEINQDIVKSHLNDAGVNVVIAENGKHALHEFKKVNFDLILMDIQLPDIDGYKVTEIIRSKKKGKDIKILALTANAFEEDINKCINAGMDDVITKPIRRKDFLKKICNALKVK